MLRLRYSTIIASALLTTLSACSVTDNTFLADNSDSNLLGSDDQNDNILVVESLVSEAGTLGDQNVEGSNANQSSETAEEAVHLTEPVTPTVAMTANRVVERSINNYLQNRRTELRIWAERGNTYFPMIEEIFAEEGIPDELKYIALGESGLRPTVRSSAGAVGMWQFMSATGRGAGLEINEWVDERKDPEKATRAAAKHLKELYVSYSGNWHLVLAGYNCSYRCISRAVRRAGGSIDNPPSFWEIYPFLPRETRAFVPKFISAALIVSNPEMYGIFTENLGQEISYDIVLIEGMLSLDDAATLAGVDLASIRNLNPSLRKGSLPDADQPYPLKVPLGTYDRFVNAFAALPPEAKAAPDEYIIQSGDTLGRIARQFKTSVSELQAFNNIRGHMIHPKQKLLIPGTGISTDIAIVSTERQSVSYGEAQYRPIKLQEGYQLVEQAGSTEEKPLMAVSLDADIIDDLMIPTIYKVRSGDTLGAIAKQFSLSINDIRQWNNIRGSTIFINQELTLHTGASAPVAITTYKVQSGDNLSAIARRFGVSVSNLKRWNGLNDNMIFPGQDLQLN